MSPIKEIGQAFEGIQQAKIGAPAFCTNFFPVQTKLQGWIDHGELLAERRAGAVFFLRKDHEFWHLYFCAADVPTLQREMATLSSLSGERVVVDLVGREGALEGMLNAAETSGFRRYRRLLRLIRASEPGRPQLSAASTQVVWADQTDRRAISELLEGSFDRYADQLAMPYEIEGAITARQILVIRCDGVLAALLFFETQGLTSTVRYWVVAERFRSQRFGAALMHHYFALHPAVRRFLLWVTADNEEAVHKYRHYGYLPEGLIDHVLVNPMIHS